MSLRAEFFPDRIRRDVAQDLAVRVAAKLAARRWLVHRSDRLMMLDAHDTRETLEPVALLAVRIASPAPTSTRFRRAELTESQQNADARHRQRVEELFEVAPGTPPGPRRGETKAQKARRRRQTHNAQKWDLNKGRRT